MKPPRRAVPRNAAISGSASGRTSHTALAARLRGLTLALSVALAAVSAVMALFSVRVARRVVRPSGRVPDTQIMDVDVAAQTITLARTPDTELPGRYGLFTVGTSDYVKIGTVLSSDAGSVTRKLLTEIGADAHLAAEAAFSGWYYNDPEQLHLPFERELVGAPVGPCPAWIFPAADDVGDGTWVIQIHGRGTTRAECLRSVPLFHARGITSMLVSYRNDGEAPRSKAGSYMLGATEWRDVDAAIALARRRGAQRILLMGWSMGGSIALQLELFSAHRDRFAGLILESPVVDWRTVLNFQARETGIPAPVAGLAIGALQSEWITHLAGADGAIPFDRLDIVAHAERLRHPILLLHSDDDGFVPSDASRALHAARPDLVDLQVFETARHTKLWNYDQDRWTQAIGDWLDRREQATRASRVDG